LNQFQALLNACIPVLAAFNKGSMKKIPGLFLLLIFFDATAQPTLDDPKLAEPYDSAASAYYSSQNKSFAIYNGRIFYGYPGMIGHAFFPEDGSDWQTGNILYDGTWYHGIKFIFDVYKEELVVLQPNSIPVRLLSNRVDQFSYQGRSFVRMQPDKDNVLKAGFYEQAVNGEASLLIRRIKQVDEKIEGMTVERRFVILDRYYILKDGIYHAVHKQRGAMSVLKEGRQGMAQHLKRKEIKFRKNKERALIEMVNYFNQRGKKQ
jgi:hypothetical protein